MNEEKEKEVPLPKGAIETYESDTAEALKETEKGGRFVRKVIEEEREKEQIEEMTAEESKRNIAYVLASVLLVIAGAGLIVYFLGLTGRTITPETPQQIPAFFFVESQGEIDATGLSGRTLARNIWSQINIPLEKDELKHFYLTERSEGLPAPVRTGGQAGTKSLVTSSRFLTLLESRAPTSFIQWISPLFMLGVHNTQTPQPFLVFKATQSYNASVGLREWEEKMLDDLYLLFGLEVKEQSLFNKPFEDILIKNKNARAILTENGDITLVYLFTDPETILITTNKETVEEIIQRLEVPAF